MNGNGAPDLAPLRLPAVERDPNGSHFTATACAACVAVAPRRWCWPAAYLEDRLADDEHHTLPRHEDDYSWDACSDLLFQDHDVLMLFDASLAGIEAPGNPANQRLGAGDLRVDSWFEPFDNGVARNPQRGFRR